MDGPIDYRKLSPRIFPCWYQNLLNKGVKSLKVQPPIYNHRICVRKLYFYFSVNGILAFVGNFYLYFSQSAFPHIFVGMLLPKCFSPNCISYYLDVIWSKYLVQWNVKMHKCAHLRTMKRVSAGQKYKPFNFSFWLIAGCSFFTLMEI